MLEENQASINQCIKVYQPKRGLTVFKGERFVLPDACFPSLEIEPSGSSNNWGTTRAQRPRHTFKCVLTTRTQNEKLHLEYIMTVATRLVEIVTSPENLQMQVLNESKWDFTGGLVDTFILDSLVEDVTYNSNKEGTIRSAEFSWFALLHEPYPESKWSHLGEGATTPTVLRPKIIV